MEDLFSSSELNELKELKNTPTAFLKDESDFFKAMGQNAEGAPEVTIETPPDPNKSNYRDLGEEQAKGNFKEPPSGGNQFDPFANQNKGKVNIGEVLSAKMGVTVIDNALPLALVLVFRFALDIKVQKKSLQMTADEKKTLEPIIEECLKTINVNFSNPWNALGFTLAAIYGTKAAEVGLNEWDKKKEENPEGSEKPTNDTAAPFGYDDAGNVKAPYGFTADGKVRKDLRGTRGQAKNKR